MVRPNSTITDITTLEVGDTFYRVFVNNRQYYVYGPMVLTETPVPYGTIENFGKGSDIILAPYLYVVALGQNDRLYRMFAIDYDCDPISSLEDSGFYSSEPCYLFRNLEDAEEYVYIENTLNFMKRENDG